MASPDEEVVIVMARSVRLIDMIDKLLVSLQRKLQIFLGAALAVPTAGSLAESGVDSGAGADSGRLVGWPSWDEAHAWRSSWDEARAWQPSWQTSALS